MADLVKFEKMILEAILKSIVIKQIKSPTDTNKF